jgi:hypothetical protein
MASGKLCAFAKKRLFDSIGHGSTLAGFGPPTSRLTITGLEQASGGDLVKNFKDALAEAAN